MSSPFFTGKKKDLALEEVSSQLLLPRTGTMTYPVTLNLLTRARSCHLHALKQSKGRTLKAEKKILLITKGHKDLAPNFSGPVSLTALGLALTILVKK